MLTNGECVLVETPIQLPESELVLHGEPDNVDRVWLLSVRHSGTHYMWTYLESLGYQRAIVFWETMTQRHQTTQRQFIHAHLEVGHEYQRHMTTEKIVMPLRNPIEVFKSHVYRYRWDFDQYEPYIINAFDRFKTVVDNYDAFVFVVDAEDQQQEVQQLGEYLDSHSLTYKEQAKNIATNRVRPVTFLDGFTETQVELFNNVPHSIQELANQYGY